MGNLNPLGATKEFVASMMDKIDEENKNEDDNEPNIFI